MAINDPETDDLLRTIAAGVAPATGETFFKLLVEHLCKALKTDFACISELVGPGSCNANTVRAFSFYGNDTFLDEVEYEVAGTPCAEALSSGCSSFPRNVQASFPQDLYLQDLGIESYLGVALTGSSGQPLGILSVMSRSAMIRVSSAEAILRIFASRVSSELERRRAERLLRESESRNTAILGALPDLIFVTDRMGVIESVYATNARELTSKRESIQGKTLHSALGPEPAQLILDASATLHGDAPALVEYSITVSGQRQFFEARSVRLGDERLLMVIRNTTDRRNAEADLLESQRFTQRLAETTPNVLFLFDLIDRRNVYSNNRSIDVIGYTPQEIAQMGEGFIRNVMHPDDVASLPALGREYSSRQDGEVFEHIFRMRHKNGSWRWVQRTATVFSRTPEGLPRQILGSVTDITSLKEAERELQELSARLLNIQDEERRRIARELHDGTGQNLTAIGLNLTVLERSATLDDASRNIVAECRKLCEESKQEIRTLSFLLHPPMLDQFGLIGALEWYINGFKQRTHMNVTIEGGHDIGRLPSELEIDVFRVIQEALTNVARYSGSDSATVQLSKTEARITVRVEDRGRGVAGKNSLHENGQFTPAGVGIPSMRERLRHHGGSLDIRSNGHGTILTAVIPVPAATAGP